MSENRRYDANAQLDIEQILLEARNRWLRPAEICEILKNHQRFRIAPEPPTKPPSGSLFLFNRKVLRYFRKDGHNWRKKKDGKTVKEAHERLKAGSVDVLHCYYAHGEDNENFQRRSYWMLEEELMHIVLVHYLEVKGSKTNINYAMSSGEISQNTFVECYSGFNDLVNRDHVVPSQTTDSSSLNSPHLSEYEDVESDNHQASSGYYSFAEVQQSEDGPVMNAADVALLNANASLQCPGKIQQCNFSLEYAQFSHANTSTASSDTELHLTLNELHKDADISTSWDEVRNYCSLAQRSAASEITNIEGFPGEENLTLERFLNADFSAKQSDIFDIGNQPKWQVGTEGSSQILPVWLLEQGMHVNPENNQGGSFQQHYMNIEDMTEDSSLFAVEQNRLPDKFHSIGLRTITSPSSLLNREENQGTLTENVVSVPVNKHLLVDILKTGEGLRKVDSFSRWMSKELEDVDKTQNRSTSDEIWTTDESGNVIEDSNMSSQLYLDTFLLGPPLSQEQLFSIHDFSPNWAYVSSEAKVLIVGSFLKDKNEIRKHEWSCMFGEVEVPAEVVGDGFLRCHAPVHKAGRVPFCITSSNRVACSEVREFEFINDDSCENIASTRSELLLRVQLAKLLLLETEQWSCLCQSAGGPHMHDQTFSASTNSDDWTEMLNLTESNCFSIDMVKEQLLQKLFREKLQEWLIEKTKGGGKGPNILDKDGQGVLHLVAALGYDWAISPIVSAGVNINFRDFRGWTALHWAASHGRENTVVALISLGGAPGALTDPTPEFPNGRTAADLASLSGHKGIAGYLAEAALTSHLSLLTLNANPTDTCANVVPALSDQAHMHISGNALDSLSLKESLSAVCNAAQAAARIQEVFRVNSFHRKQVIEFANDKFGISDERALSLVSIKSNHSGGAHDEPAQLAAIKIQKKYRGWKGRRDFLVTRQRIVKIQALVRGHQVRKTYRKIVWSVGIVEKVILRWRRKGSGLRGLKEALSSGSSMMVDASKEDDYDFLHEGRKQTEARLERALARVKSMVQYPEARDQYRRLRNAVTEFQAAQMLLDESDDSSGLLDLETLLQDDTSQSIPN